jgi:gliding motility-associated-like protein
MMRYLFFIVALLPLALFGQVECDVTTSTTPISCAGEADGSATVETLSGGPFVYSWDGGVPGPDATITDLPAGIYTVIVADPVTMCISELVVILEDPGIIALGNLVYCPSDAPVLTGTPIGGYEPLYYAWSTGDTTNTLAFPAGTEGTFTVNSIDADGCEAEFEFELMEMPSPTAVMGIPDTACQNVRVQVLTLATNGDSLVWRWGVDGYSNAYNDLISFTESGYQPISLQAFDTLGCGSLPTLDSIYIEAQVPAIFTATQIPCTPELDILLGSDTDSCAFFFGDELVTNDCNGYIRFNAQRYDFHTFTLYATQPNGCNDTLEVTVDVRTEPTLFLANAFSPDGDGINERWPDRVDIPALGYEVAVYDRWGILVWSATDPSAQWDGTTSGGQVPVGVYAYTMKHRDPCEPTNEVSSRGHVTVVR